jgi:hypothetical protein
MAQKEAPIETKLVAPNGHTVSLQVGADGATVLSHYDESGQVLSRTCSGRCGDTQVGPISCPEGQSPDLNCTTSPPSISCR